MCLIKEYTCISITVKILKDDTKTVEGEEMYSR